MSTFWLVVLGMVSGTAAGLLAGLIGFGGGVVIVPVVFYGLVEAGTPADQAAHIAVGTSLPVVLPTALVSSWAHWRPDQYFCASENKSKGAISDHGSASHSRLNHTPDADSDASCDRTQT